MSLKINFESGAAAIPIDALSRICDDSESTNVKYLCLLIMHGGSYRPIDEINAELVSLGLINESEIQIASAFLQGAGLLITGNSSAQKKAPSPKKAVRAARKDVPESGDEADEVTSDSIKEWMEQSNGRREFVKACEDVYGNVFNKTELTTVLTYSQEYRLRDECILAILGYSRENGFGIAYTKKIFNRMVDNGLNTLDSVNAELAFLSEHSSYVTVVKQIFGLSRALTTGEKPKVERWHKEYKFPRELIQLAFDRAAAKEKASIAYCDKILIGWHEEGLHTADAVKNKLKSDKSKISSKIEATYSVSDFFNAAVERSYSDDKKEK